MADTIKISFKNEREVREAVKRLGSRMPDAVQKAMVRATLFLQGAAVSKKLSGQVLRRRTGRLATGIATKVVKVGKAGFVGIVGSNVKYARIHEFGGVIRPKNAPFLVFKIGDRVIKTKRVVMPKRPYIKPTFVENQSRIADIFRKTLIEFAKETVKNQ